MAYEPQILEIPCNCALTPRDLLVLPICQLCGGSGYLVDWTFDIDGNLSLTTGLPKLQQDIIKIMVSYLGSNELYPDYGSDIDQNIGSKNLGTHTEVKLKSDILNSLDTLKRDQQDLNRKFNNLNSEETLESVESIVIDKVSETAYVIVVVFTTAASVSSSVSTTVGGVVDKATQQASINQIFRA
jgi:hypothetical protein